MIAASFLVNDLQQDWREGESFFANFLSDYDPVQNGSGWQQVAFKQQRFSPLLQQKKFDPECEFVRKWVPEISDCQKRDILKMY